jgi:serine/threonine protein kinase
MEVFELLWLRQQLRSSIVFPISFYLEPDATKPDILFLRLSNDWNIGVPSIATIRTPYCALLKEVVKRMHEAGLVHLDLMPCNIAWKSTNNKEIEIKLLDFDTASDIGLPISESTLNKQSPNSDYAWNCSCSIANPEIDAWFCFLFENVNAQFLVQRSINAVNAADDVLKKFYEFTTEYKHEELLSRFESWYQNNW